MSEHRRIRIVGQERDPPSRIYDDRPVADALTSFGATHPNHISVVEVWDGEEFVEPDRTCEACGAPGLVDDEGAGEWVFSGEDYACGPCAENLRANSCCACGVDAPHSRLEWKVYEDNSIMCPVCQGEERS